MAKRCKYCFNKVEEGVKDCPVCSLDQVKDKKEMSKEEKRTAYYVRAIYIMGFLAIVGGFLGVFGSLALIISSVLPEIKADMLIFSVVNFIMAGVFLFFGISVRKFKRWCYSGGIIIYLLSAILGLFSKQYFTIIWSTLFISYIASPVAKKVFYRG